jgi:hypothetical protein
MRICPS